MNERRDRDHRLATRRPTRGGAGRVLLSARLLALSVVSCLVVVFVAGAAGAPFPGRSSGSQGPGFGVPGFGVPGLGVPGSPGGFGLVGPFGGRSGSLGSALVGSAPTGVGPSQLADDPATHTLYVANGLNENGPTNPGGNTVSVIDTRHCQAFDVSRCPGPWPTITIGNLPSTIAVDEATNTVYVANSGDNTVSVFNGATCDALNTSGCGQTPATVPVGLGPNGIFADDANHTVYVANFDSASGPNTVSMIDSATCDAADLGGCPTSAPPTVNVGNPPDDIAVNDATHTVYVATLTNTVVFDADTCNATVQSGCGTQGTLTGDAYSGPPGFGLDEANDTLYTANYDNSISAFDLADCDASDLAGCASQTPGTVLPFPYEQDGDSSLWLTVDVPLHSVYVVYQGDDALAVVDTNVCNGSDLSACATLHPPVARTGDDPESVVLDPQTQTLYTANQADNDVSVIDASRCNAQVTSGCRQAPPAVPIPAGSLVADPAVNTVYAVTTGNNVAMINTRSCNSSALAGCSATPPQLTAGTESRAVAVDPLTDTVYVANFGSYATPGPSTISVINAAICNATDTAGCAEVSTLQVPGGNADDIAVDAATDTVYVGTLTDTGPNLLSVFNGATCNATTTTGCTQTPGTIEFGDSGGAFNNSIVHIAVNQMTNTIYATNIANLNSMKTGDNVYVINGATCDATNTACSQPAAVITVGKVPWGVTVDQATDTIYVANWASGDYAGSVSVINGATCNGANTTGCNQPLPTVATGFGVLDIAVDPTTHNIYATNLEDASISIISGASCNRLVSFSCNQTPPTIPAGTYPSSIAVDPAVGTAYVSSAEGLPGVSVIPLTP